VIRTRSSFDICDVQLTVSSHQWGSVPDRGSILSCWSAVIISFTYVH
jgi:hypothetical protein